MLALVFACRPSLVERVNELHRASRQIESEVAPKLEDLIQQKNSINIQGRALTSEEIEFSGKVSELEATFARWKEGMEAVEKKSPDESRLDVEITLKDAIVAFKKQVESLAPKPKF